MGLAWPAAVAGSCVLVREANTPIVYGASFFLALGVALVNGKVGRWPRLGRDLGTHHISWAAVPE